MASTAVLWTDTHCHLQDQFLEDEQARAAVLDRALEADVRRAVCIGTGLEASEAALALAARVAEQPGAIGLWASVGLHPHAAEQPIAPIAALIERAVANGPTPGSPGSIVAVGECGLDYFYKHSPRSAQRHSFIEQVELAHRFDLTVVVHTRDAWADTYSILGEVGMPDRVVIHCFTGGPAEAERLLELGCFLSFSGIVTFKNAESTREAVRLCPGDRLLVETDSPFLAPVPYRGRQNEPAYVRVVGEAVAELRGVSPASLAETTSVNAVRAFGLRV